MEKDPFASPASYDIAILGGGILGASIAYWLGELYPRLNVVCIEQASGIARHTSLRNTGVLHRPFYLHPEQKKVFARAAQISYGFWKDYAAEKQLSWNPVGTIEVSTRPEHDDAIDKYAAWSKANGMDDSEWAVMSGAEVARIEPHVRCRRAFFAKTDTAVDFGELARALADDAEDRGVSFRFKTKVRRLEPHDSFIDLIPDRGEPVRTRYLVNVAGGGALRIAHALGVATAYADLNFRGDYWVVDPAVASFATHNIYTVPAHREFPFLDPHWIVRADGRREIGPSAVPVFGPYAYRGFFENPLAGARKLFERPFINKLRILTNPDFFDLALTEWKSSLSKRAMAKRASEFIPDLRPEHLTKPGFAGVRSNLIDANGKFVKEALELFGERSFHILNFNSPGATGAPAYAVRIIQKLVVNGTLSQPTLESTEFSRIAHALAA